MTMTARALGGGSRRRLSMTTEAMGALQADSDRLAAKAGRPSGYVTTYVSGEPDAPSLIPNIDG